MSKSELTVDKHYEFVSTQARYHTEAISRAFNRFVTTFSAIVAGSVWLSLQPAISHAKTAKLAFLADLLVVSTALVCATMVVENLRGWFGYRMAMHRIGGDDADGRPVIPAPNLGHASKEEVVMLSVMIAVTVLF